MVGGQEHTWVRPLKARSLAQARVRRRAGRERRRAQAQCRPAWPTSACFSMGARRQPRVPAPGPRPKVRAQHSGKEGGKAVAKRMRAQSPVRGGGTVERPPSCLPLLTCVLGGVRTTPLPRKRRGEGPLLVAAFAGFKFPWGLQLLPLPFFHYLLSHHRGADGGWGK